jgi:cytochrome c-type biogenesis protein CcmH
VSRLLALAAAVLLVAAGTVGSAAAQAPRASLPDIEDEVMCTICGTLLEESQSPQADRERALIRTLIAQGKDKDQIKDALVAQYGPRVLATPSGHGFDLLAWIVPGLGILLAAVAIVFGLRRTLRSRGGRDEEPRLDPADAERLEADLARYDA